MKYNDFINLINDKVSINDFFCKYNQEIINYIESSLKSDSCPIISADEIEIITEHEMIKLLSYYINNIIYEWDLEFILSYLEMSYIGLNEKIEEIIVTFSNPYTHTFINKKNIKNAIEYINNNIEDLNLDFLTVRQKQKEKELRPNYDTILKIKNI